MYIFKITKAKPRADQINLLGVLGCNILFNIVKVSAVATIYTAISYYEYLERAFQYRKR